MNVRSVIVQTQQHHVAEMNLQQRALSQFDLLFERNELLWNETKPVIVPSHPFDVS
jgi:hypothetical protein